MSALGSLIVFGLIVTVVTGLALVVSARRPAPPSPLPPAQIVGGPASPIAPPARGSLSLGRLYGGLFLILVGGGGLLFVWAVAGLAEVANH